jgi:hypothetical protein
MVRATLRSVCKRGSISSEVLFPDGQTKLPWEYQLMQQVEEPQEATVGLLVFGRGRELYSGTGREHLSL